MKNMSLFASVLCGALIGACSDDGASALTQPASQADATSSGDADPTAAGAPDTTGATTETGDVSATDDVAATDDMISTTGEGGEIFNCDPWAQDCPAGLKCMAYTDEGDFFTGTKCTPVVENPGQAGDVCHAEGGWSTGIDDCDLGLACWNINPETHIGACAALCTGTMDAYDCPSDAEVCVFWVPGLAHVCLQTCDPLQQDCPGTQLCNVSGENFVCMLDWSFDEGQEFDACNSGNGCDKGLVCWDPTQAIECAQDQNAGCCLAYCDLTAPQCNGEGAECKPLYEEGQAPPEYANVGICGLPG